MSRSKKTKQLITAASIAGAALAPLSQAQAFWGPFDWFDGPGWGYPGYYGHPGYWGGYPGYYGYPGYWGGYPGYYGYPGYWGGYPGYYGGPAYNPAAGDDDTQDAEQPAEAKETDSGY